MNYSQKKRLQRNGIISSRSPFRLAEPMKRVCSECGFIYDDNGRTAEKWNGSDVASHGICGNCQSKTRQIVIHHAETPSITRALDIVRQYHLAEQDK